MATSKPGTGLRPRICSNSECRALFFLCARCDRGQRYCSLSCRGLCRRRRHRSANRRYQQSPHGRLDHQDRQRRFRCRPKKKSVTDQSSHSATFHPSSESDLQSPVPQQPTPPRLPSEPSPLPSGHIGCRLCGHHSPIVEPLPPPLLNSTNSEQPVTPPDEATYVATLILLYSNLPETPLHIGPQDHSTARRLYHQGVSLTLAECALLLASLRRLFRDRTLPPLSPIRSLAYFQPVIAELQQQPLPEFYLQHLRLKLQKLAPHP